MYIRTLLFFLMTFGFVVSANAAKIDRAHHREPKSRVEQTINEQAVNINTADADAFASIKGIGPRKAEAIVAYRKANGKFNSIDDLTKVKGIGEKRLQKIKQNLTM